MVNRSSSAAQLRAGAARFPGGGDRSAAGGLLAERGRCAPRDARAPARERRRGHAGPRESMPGRRLAGAWATGQLLPTLHPACSEFAHT